MTALLTENILFWLIPAAFFFIAGWGLATAWGKPSWLLKGAAVGLVFLAAGVIFVFFVPTDRKAIRRAVYDIASAVERNDIPGVLALIDESADKTRQKAAFHMGLATLNRANVGQLQIKSVNRFTSPPTAVVAFNGSVTGHEKMFGSEFTVLVNFDDVELGKGRDGKWRVTDNCHFRYPGYNGD